MLYNGSTAITTAEDITITDEINGEKSISFFLPWGDPYKGDIVEGTVITERYYGNQNYVVEKIEKEKSDSAGYRISGRHVYFTAEKKFIAAFEHQNGVSAADIFEDIWENVSGFSVLSAAGITALGMTPVTTITDIEDKGKTDPISLTNALIKAVGQGEVYIDNKTVALVEEVGEQHNRLTIGLTQNADSITVSTDITNVVTRLYGYGKNDLDVTEINQGKAYIDSPNMDPNAIKEGYMDFSEIGDKDMLLDRMEWQFDSDNPCRIDVPYTTISCKFIDLSGIDQNTDMPHLGQSVSVEGYTDKRIIKIVRKPLDPADTDITIGQVKKDLFYFLRRANDATIKIENGDINISNNPQVITQIEEITKQSVVAAEVIEASAAFIDDLQIERLETNLKNYIVLPNITVTNNVPTWDGQIHTWRAKPGHGGDPVRGYIKIAGMEQEFIEAQLVVPSDSTAMTEAETTAVQVSGRQLYFTSIAGAQAFEYLTFTAPRSKYPSMSTDVADMYVVRKRKSQNEYVKMKQSFDWSATDSTYYVKTQYGVGDVQGRGVYYFIKDADSGRFVYTSRQTGEENGIVLSDDGIFNRLEGTDHPMLIFRPYESLDDAEDDTDLPMDAYAFVAETPAAQGGGGE